MRDQKVWVMVIIFYSIYLVCNVLHVIWDVSYLTVDQGDVQYFIGVQLDGTERVRDAAAKDGAMLVCAYFTKNLHVCARYLIKYQESKEEQIKMPDICLAANMLSKEAFCCGCLQYLLAFSNIKILLNI